MYRCSFKIKHKNCYETKLSEEFPEHYIAVIDIQSKNKAQKQYFYSITGEPTAFNKIITYLQTTKHYTYIKEAERTKKQLLLHVELNQLGYVQNLLQRHHSFLIDIHTVYGGYEYWDIGTTNKKNIQHLLKDLRTIGDVNVIYLGEITFAQKLLSEQQKKIFTYAYKNGYYELPRKLTIATIAKHLKLNPSTVGEHLMKAENKLILFAAKRI
ncbi:MAG TPA: helix-turn-helix domain-containing protein [Candidatus Nanoarchaeia archaeon]|nr:helix-turn-helix domain-containing protein [Candidatus Nanoarchaeia archaeon]